MYVRNFTKVDIQALEKRANKNNYEPYKIDTLTPYHYIIRETGGIATNAYVDGRNKAYGKNKFYLSNIGTETYLINLGYSKIEEDMNSLKTNYLNYMEGIVNALKIIL